MQQIFYGFWDSNIRKLIILVKTKERISLYERGLSHFIQMFKSNISVSQEPDSGRNDFLLHFLKFGGMLFIYSYRNEQT